MAFLPTLILTVPSIAVSIPLIVTTHDRRLAKAGAKMTEKEKRIQRAGLACAAIVGLVGLPGFEATTGAELSTGWGIGHGSFLLVCPIVAFTVVLSYWIFVSVAKKANQSAQPTRGKVPRG